jgi:hypothetical protein
MANLRAKRHREIYQVKDLAIPFIDLNINKSICYEIMKVPRAFVFIPLKKFVFNMDRHIFAVL